MFCKKGVLLCHVSLMRTLVDLFCTKRLFSQETVFSPYYFTRDKNGFVLQRISYSRAINKVKTGTLCRILNYSTEHLKYRITRNSYLLRIEKKSVIFSGSKQIPQRNIIILSRKICKSLPEYLICQGALSLPSNYNPDHVNIPHKRAIF